jgi:putative nucleotidyltransferase with HDIG domain
MASSCYETDRHCRRVASLARRIAESIGVDAAVRDALDCAALEHQKFRLRRLRRTESAVPGITGLILQSFAGGSGAADASIRIASDVLRICNAFDEAIEFAIYESRPMNTAIHEFLNDEDAWPPEVFAPLRALVQPSEKTAHSGNLPILPNAVSALLRTDPETICPAALARIAERDPVLSGRLLGLANSAAFGPRQEIRSVRDAILRIGIPVAHKALIAAALGPLFASGSLRALWRRSCEVAAIAHELAPECGCHAHEAWLAGLMHDIGRLVFASGSAAARRREEAWLQEDFPLSYIETIAWGIDHAQAGADLLASWNVPARFVEAVRHHAAPELTGSALSALLYLAENAISARGYPLDLASGYRTSKALFSTGLAASALESIRREAPVFMLAS